MKFQSEKGKKKKKGTEKISRWVSNGWISNAELKIIDISCRILEDQKLEREKENREGEMNVCLFSQNG